MWHAVASGSATLRTLRQDRPWTRRVAAEPGSRTRAAGWNSLDGILGVVCDWRSGGNSRGAHGLRRYLPHPRRPASRGHGVAAASAHFFWMADPGAGRDRLLYRVGFVAAGGVGAAGCAGGGLSGAVEDSAGHRARHLHTLGASACAIR